MNDKFVFMASYNEMRNYFTFLRVGIAKKFGKTCSVKSWLSKKQEAFSSNLKAWFNENIWKPKPFNCFGPVSKILMPVLI